MTQLRGVSIAAFFLGIGMAGEPFVPMHALLAALILAFIAIGFEKRSSPLLTFLVGFLGVMLTCYLQHNEVYPGTGVVGFGLGALAATSLGRRTAPAAVAVIGTVVGTGLFFLL